MAAGTMKKLDASAVEGELDASDQLNMFEAFQKVVIVNGANLKVADFMNVKISTIDVRPDDENNVAPMHGTILTYDTTNQILVDFCTANNGPADIYGYVISGTIPDSAVVLAGTNATGTPTAVSFTKTAVAPVAKPHWYTYTVYPTIGAKSYGTMPAKAYIGCLYRGRVVLSGNPNAPFQWYMSRQGNIWDFAYVANDAQTPVAGGNSDAGELGDIVRALIPYRDDYLIFGCATSMWVMRGDPAAGGSLDELDLTVGMFGANSWCFDGEGNLYFFGTNGIYRIPMGFKTVENLTQFSLPKIIKDEAIDASTHRITMAYDRIRMGLVICITTLASGKNSNYWFDLRAQGFFPESYPEECGPYSLFHYAANDEDYRDLLVGCRDGYIRKFDEAAKDDVGVTNKAISSYFGTVQPLGDGEDRKGKLTSLTVTTGGGASGTTFGNTDGVSYEYHVGDDAETVLEDMIDSATARESGTLSGTGRKSRIRKRARGHFLGLKFYNSSDTETFAIEKISGEIKPAGKN